MQFLNYHHLMYFWMVAREGSIVRASEKLNLAPSTISSQIRSLEESLEVDLFDRSGRSLVQTDMGRRVFRYADEIFTTGQEMLDAIEGKPVDRPLRFEVGISDVIPKLVARKLLEPVFDLEREVRLICHEDRPDRLFADLQLHRLDVVLVDSPMGAGGSAQAYNHLLGECEVLIFGAAQLCERWQGGFPASMEGERPPFLLPTSEASMRRAVDRWFEQHQIRPRIVGEFEDSALMKVFGQSGAGFFPAPAVIRDEICSQYGVEVFGPVESSNEQFYAITSGRRLRHPAVVALSEAARDTIFVEERE